MIDFSTPLAGLERATASLNQTARRLAGASFPQTDAAPADAVDLSAEMVSLMEAKNAFKINITLIHTSDEVARSVLDVLG